MPTWTFDRRGGRGPAAEGIGEGDVVLLRLPSDSTYVVRVRRRRQGRCDHAGVNPRLAPPEQAAVGAVAGGALELDSVDQVEGLTPPDRSSRSPTTRNDRWRWCSRPAPPASPRGAVPQRQLAAITRIDVADAWGDPDAARPDARRHPVRPRRVHHEAARGTCGSGSTTHILGRGRAADALACIVEHRIPSLGGVAPRRWRCSSAKTSRRMSSSCVKDDRDGRRRVAAGDGARGDGSLRRRYSIRYSSTESGGCGTGTAFDADEEEALFTGRATARRDRGRDLRRRGWPAPGR
jgi:hypothetical protein